MQEMSAGWKRKEIAELDGEEDKTLPRHSKG